MMKAQIDEQRQFLARLQDRVDAIEQQRIALEDEYERERQLATHNPEAAATYGVYVQRMLVKAKELQKQYVIAQAAVDEAREKLMELFGEQKRYEIAIQVQKNEESKELKKKEQHMLDEVGSVRFTRQQE